MDRSRNLLSITNLFRETGHHFFGEVVYPRGAGFGPRQQENLQLVIVHRGEAAVEVDGAPLRVAAGEACLLLPGHRELFRFSRAGETHHSWCHATSPKDSRATGRLLAELARKAPFTPVMAQLLAAGLVVQGSRGRAAVRESIGRAFFLEYMAACNPSVADRPPPPALERALAFIESALHRPIDGREIARAAGVSPQHLARLFRENRKETPTARLWRRRMETAAGLLASTGLGIGEIAARCGFGSPYHFSRRMREQFGCAPRELRRRAWEGR